MRGSTRIIDFNINARAGSASRYLDLSISSWPDNGSDNEFEISAILPRRLRLAGGSVRLSGRAPCLMQPGTLGGRRCASYQEPCSARAIKSAARKSLGPNSRCSRAARSVVEFR